MGLFAFLVLLALIVVLWSKLNSLTERHEFDSRRLRDLSLELDAVRRAFLGRIGGLEQQLASLRQSAQAPAEPQPSAAPPAREAPTATPPEPVPAQPPPSPEPEPPIVPPVAAQPPPPSFEPPPPPEPPPAPWGQIDWEQWIGVRGAALLGGIVLALAAVLFLQYSIEHGLIPPIVRVAIGLLTGVGCIVGSELLRKREYPTTANALAGAGAIILYAAIWSAQVLYGLIGPGLSYPLMILTTVTCGLLSWRHSAREIAVLGLAGGFATPILLSTGSDNPIGLFAYVLMLDAGLVALARKRRWPVLVTLGLVGTVLYQFAWILGRMGPDRYGLGLAILGVFSAFFVLAGIWGSKSGEESDEQQPTWRGAQAAGILIPFVFALYFAANADLGPHLYQTAILMAILCIAAAWLGKVQKFEMLPSGAAAGSLGVVAVWVFARDFTTALAWEAFAICAGLALIFHVFFELQHRRGPVPETRAAAQTALIPSFGFLTITAILPALQFDPALWPWLCAWALLAALVVRQSYAPDLGFWRVAAGGALSLGFTMFLVLHRGSPAFPSPALFLALAALACIAFQVTALRNAGSEDGALDDGAAATGAFILLLAHSLIADSPAMSWRLFLSSTLLFALFVVQAATRMSSGKLYFAAMVVASFSHLLWVGSSPALVKALDAPAAIGLHLLGAVLFTFWPFLAGPRLLRKPASIYAAALAGPAWFLSLRELYERWLGPETIGVVPVVLGAISLAAVQRARRLGPEAGPALRALVWFAAVALSFLSLAIPLQLEKEWITIGWAVQGVAILALWKRLDHPGLKYFALALLAAVSVRLLLNPEVLVYHARSSLPVLNWLAYTYLIPAAALLIAAYLLRDLEIPRRRDWEALLYQHGKPAAAIFCSLAAIFVIFFWINLTIFDFYSSGPSIEVSFDRMAARDLTLSLAWALYALLLLGIGFKRDTGGLRWLSLSFLVLTIGKVFLHDLGELEDLYRVASLVGLALSLILVSLAYQRFVFRKSSS